MPKQSPRKRRRVVVDEGAISQPSTASKEHSSTWRNNGKSLQANVRDTIQPPRDLSWYDD